MLNKLPPAYFTKTQTYGAIQVFYYKQQIIAALQAMFMKEEEAEKDKRGIPAFYVSNGFCVFMD